MLRRQLLSPHTRFTVGLFLGSEPPVLNLSDIPENNVPEGIFPEKTVIPRLRIIPF